MGCEGSCKTQVLKLFEFHVSSGFLQQAVLQQQRKKLEMGLKKGAAPSSCPPSCASKTDPSDCHRERCGRNPPNTTAVNSKRSQMKMSAVSPLTFLVALSLLLFQCAVALASNNVNANNNYQHANNNYRRNVRPPGSANNNYNYLNSRVTRDSSSPTSPNIFPGIDSIVGGASHQQESHNSNNLGDNNFQNVDSISLSNNNNRPGSLTGSNNIHHRHRHHHGLNHPNSLQTAPVGG